MKKIISLVLSLAIMLSVCPFVAAESPFDVKDEYKNSALKIFYEAEKIIYDRNTELTNNISISEDEKAVNFKGQFGGEKNGKDESLRIEIEKAGTYNVFIKAKRTGESESNKYSSVYMTTAPCNKDDYELTGYDIMTCGGESEFIWQYVGPVTVTDENSCIYIDAYRTSSNLRIDVDKVCVTNNFYYHPRGDENIQTDSGLSNKYNAENSNLEFPDNKKGKHPRLLFSESDIERIRKNFSHPENIEWYNGENGLLDRAAYDTSKNNLSYDNKWHFIAKYESQAFLYAMDKENYKEYGEEAISGIINVLKFFTTVSKEEEKNYSDPQRPRDYSVAAAGRIYDWCYNLLTPDNKKEIFSLAMENAVLSEFYFPYKTTGYSEGHNYEQKILRDNLMFAIAVYDEFPDLYNYIAGFLNDEFIPVLNMHFNDSSMHTQGDDYGDSRFVYNLWTTIIFEKLGVEHRISEKQRNMAYMNIIRRRFDTEHLMRSGDKWSGDNSAFNTATSNFLAYNLYSDPYIKKAYELCTLKDNYKDNINHAVIQPFIKLILNNVDIKPAETLDDLPLYTYMGDEMGVMTARTSWDENSMIVTMGVPEHYYGGHQHLDSGNFEIYYKNPLVIDSGNYSDFGADYRKNYTKKTVAHNAMLIGEFESLENDGGQIEKDTPTPRTYDEYSNYNEIGTVLAKDVGDNYTYLKGDITKAYYKDTDDTTEEKLNEYTRSFMFLDFKEVGRPGALIILDKADSKSKKAWLLHTVNEPEFIGETVIKSINDNTYVHNKTLLPKKTTVSKIEGNWNGNSNYPDITDGKDEEASGWRIEISPETECEKEDCFLNVVSVGDNEYDVYDSTLYEFEDNNYVGVKINDFVSFMSKETKRTTDEFEISFSDEDANKEFNIVIADLDGGLWFVKDEYGKVIYNCIVKEDNGTLSFIASAGKYTLFKENAHPISESFYVFPTSSDSVEYEGGTYNGPTGTVFAKISGKFSNYELTDFGIAISNKELTSEQFINDKDVWYGKGEKITDDFRFGIRFFGKAIKMGHTYYTLPYAKYKYENNEITIFGNKVVPLTIEEGKE